MKFLLQETQHMKIKPKKLYDNPENFWLRKKNTKTKEITKVTVKNDELTKFLT